MYWELFLTAIKIVRRKLMGNFLQDIDEKREPYIIAEIGVNYYDIATQKGISVMEAAKLMVLEAKNGGCSAAKFQTYKAGKIASKNSPAYWDTSEESTTSQYELFQKFDSFGEEEYRELSEYAASIGIDFLSTPFDFESADYLADMMPAFKISSSDLTNLPFIRHIANKGKPVMLSTGAATLGEIESAIDCVLSTGNQDVSIMHCILDYPTDYENANLLMIKHLRRVFPDLVMGFSDHTRPDSSMLVVTTAYQYGAKIIEKHFTLDKTLKGNDHYHAMDVEDCKRFVENVELLKKIDGTYNKRPMPCEAASRKQARRSIVAKTAISKGTVITEDMLTYKRPGTGISPSNADLVVGRKAVTDIEEDKLLEWSDI